MDRAEQSAADDSIIDTIAETASARQQTGGDGYRTDSAARQTQTTKPIINVQATANNASHDIRDKGGTGAADTAASRTGQRSDAHPEHRSQTSDRINAGAVETRSMRVLRH